MKRPYFFVFLLFVCSALLLFIDIPVPLNFGEVNIPVVNKKINLNFDSSYFSLNLGPVNLAQELNYKLGLDLQGGSSFTYQVDMSEIPEEKREDAFDGARNIIERRINFFGVTEPTIQSIKLADEYRIQVDLPGSTDVDQTLSLIGQTAQLSFWEGSDEPFATEEAKMFPLFMDQVFQTKPVETSLTGKDLQSAKVSYGSNDGTPQVQLKFSAEGADKFGAITQKNVGKPVAIVLDNVVITSPVVQQPILSGDAVISGNFTQDRAKSLAIQLNSGALPAPLKLISQTTLGPTLGLESLQRSIVGGVLGFLSLVVFMVLIYKKEGLLASVALSIYVIIVLSIFKILPITLTLAGIAGFILSVGMAVDANILIFERMREEARAGKPKQVAITLGFRRAWSSIRDSNITSLITTAILFYFGNGIIRGFAVALAIGILVSMFSAIVVTRNLLKVFEKGI